jgi:ketosteroid isomerase-like protein
MNPEQFISAYSSALSTQQWKNVEPLIHIDACVTFSNGTVHKGIAEIKQAYERNFTVIKNEDYTVSNIHWIKKSDELAIYLFDFNWTGYIDGKSVSGKGRGTAVIIYDGKHWKILTEHLGAA